ncbi:hypothetical protein L0337_04235 [candidate division KSB1 bacterium]|nr:hypothetical protein [candidate division KSB1 bacterium]
MLGVMRSKATPQSKAEILGVNIRLLDGLNSVTIFKASLHSILLNKSTQKICKLQALQFADFLFDLSFKLFHEETAISPVKKNLAFLKYSS